MVQIITNWAGRARRWRISGLLVETRRRHRVRAVGQSQLDAGLSRMLDYHDWRLDYHDWRLDYHGLSTVNRQRQRQLTSWHLHSYDLALLIHTFLNQPIPY